METIENPTQPGASIESRLEAYLSAEDAPVEEAQAEEEAPEAPAEEAAVEETDAGDGEAEVEGPQIAAEDLAALLGVEVDTDEDGSLLVKTKIDGKEGTAKFQDVLAAYQLRGHIDNQAREAAEARKAAQAAVEEARNAAQQRLQQIDDIARIAQDELMREYNAIDWQTLRIQDPGEYAARIAEFQQRQGKLGEMAQRIQSERAKNAEEMQHHTAERLEKEAAKLRELIPGWNDEVTATRERGEIKEWATKELARWGESPELLASVDRGFGVDVLRKAMLYDKLQASKETIEKKVRVAPKLVKPGQAVSKADQTRAAHKELKTTIKKSGGKQGVVEYLLATGKV